MRRRGPECRWLGVLLGLMMALAIGGSPAGAAVFDFYEGENVDFDFSTRRGLRLRVEEPDLSFRVGGRLHLDFAAVEDDRTSVQRYDHQIRRGRLYLKSRLFERFRFMVDRELAPDRRGWRNVWGELRIAKGLGIRVGNFVAPFGLEDVTASNHSTFLERSVSSRLAPSFQTGVLLKTSGRLGSKRTRHRWTFRVAGLMEPLGESSDDRHRSEHLGLAARLTYAPVAKRGRVFHFGAAVEQRWLRNDSLYRVSARPESIGLPILLSTTRLGDVESVTGLGAELAAILGPFTFQGEYMHGFLQRDAGRSDAELSGGYAQASWVLTGESRRYSRGAGAVTGLDPKSRWGALELGVRVSALDLNDREIDGGRAYDLTLGASWYLRPNVRLMLNYVYADTERSGDLRSDDPHAVQGRFLIFF